ncbi:unnamed protein product [Durusdinium trenchii]|uniref:Uncharacterized protein n=1 Tax=Durusdinium trenchii TaxID=1381693 RepID=A0ABP0N9W6_9DINO
MKGSTGLPLEAFDTPMDFEVHTPQEWLSMCHGPAAGKPQACVLHYIAHEWRMLPCWVLGYEASNSRYLVELEDGSRKQVKRLALRFNAEDPQNFQLRVETCRAKRAHCELQQAFIKFIESQPDELVSPVRREQKERFIRQGLHRSHLEDSNSFVGHIRDLIREIEENYILSMKFAKVKNDLILEMGTPYACVRDDTPFAPLSETLTDLLRSRARALLRSRSARDLRCSGASFRWPRLRNFLPVKPPQYGLVQHQAESERCRAS